MESEKRENIMAKWFESALFYHIYPLGMLGAEKFHTQEEESHKILELIDWIPHLKQLGCGAIYIGPFFESVSHGYETTDYTKVDRRLGSNEELRQYIQACHKQDIKVVVDGVFNHTGREFFAFQDLCQRKKLSLYQHWYCGVDFSSNTPYEDGFSYEAWRGHYELPRLNLKNHRVTSYLYEVVKKWIQDFDIDGIRLDCADVLDFDFMKELRQVVDQEKEEFWLMGEVIHGDYSRWIRDARLDSVTNYELHKGLYSAHNQHNYFEIAHTIRRLYQPPYGLCQGNRLYQFVDNHDVERIASKLKDIRDLIPIYTLLYTLPGIPSIYYGSEFLMEGTKEHSDWELRKPLFYRNYIQNVKEEKVTYQPGKYHEFLEFLTKLGKYRSHHPVVIDGNYEELLLTNRQFAFCRTLQNQGIIVIVNNDEEEANLTIPIPINNGIAKHILTNITINIENSNINTTILPHSSVILEYLL